MIPTDVLSWLLDPADPSLRFRVGTELLDMPPDHRDLAACRQAIPSSPAAKRILDRMHPDGYWLQTNPRTGQVLGDGVEYGSFATTHFCLSYLAELGMHRTDERVARAAERYLRLQLPDGDWYRHFSCLYAYNIVTFLRLGYRDDPRLMRSVDLLLASGRADGGYLCELHEKPSGRSRSCIRGSAKALAAFAELGSPYIWHDSCRRLEDYFLERGGLYRRRAPEEFVHTDVHTLIFPFHWRAGLLEILLGLSRLGLGRDERLGRAWDVLESKADAQGRYPLEWSPSQSPWKVGRRGEANGWITFYAYLALKHRDQGQVGTRNDGRRGERRS